MSRYILALDQGTTSSRAILFDHHGHIADVAQQEFKQFYPQSGWVEHDAQQIWSTQQQVLADVMQKADVQTGDVAAIGITNQRETTILWDRQTGEPLHHAIVWQDRRTADRIDQLREDGAEQTVREKTGLVPDAYFSATKIAWLLDQSPETRRRAEAGELAFGTVDSWLIWKLTGGQAHLTDVTNASRTMLFNIHDNAWDEDLLELFNIPRQLLPEVRPSGGEFAKVTDDAGVAALADVPIAGVAGDQQAALFGQLCFEEGMIKTTYGTGCFLLMNTGTEPAKSHNNLLTTVAWQRGAADAALTYALEGSVFVGGAIVQWLRDELNMIESSQEVEQLARSVEDNGGVYLVPAFAGLGAPHWNAYARGCMMGLTRGANRGHIARAALEAIAFQVADVVEAMTDDAGASIPEMRVDGGASANDLLMQFQADMLQTPILRPKMTETTALGAAFLAGLTVGFWQNADDLQQQWQLDQRFEPKMPLDQVEQLRDKWRRAVDRARNWIEHDS